MKKFISVIIAVILLSSCFGISAFAGSLTVTFSDDFQKLYMGANSYSRIDASMLVLENSEVKINKIELSAAQQETVKNVSLCANKQCNVIEADIYYKDGAWLNVTFLQDDYMEEYYKLVNSQINEYIIDFAWPEGNSVKAQKEDIFGSPTTLYKNELEMCNSFMVSGQSNDGSLVVFTGSLLIYRDNYYYVDFAEAGVGERSWSFYPGDYRELSARKITDSELLESIKAAEDEFYADDFGFFYDDNFTESVSTIFIVFIFAVIPFAIFIVFLILAIRSKTFYKKLFGTVCILSAAELTVFAIIATFIMLPK